MEKNEKGFVAPGMEIIRFKTEDIIIASSGVGGEQNGDDDNI